MGLNDEQSMRTLFTCSLQKHFMGLLCFHLTKYCIAYKFYY